MIKKIKCVIMFVVLIMLLKTGVYADAEELTVMVVSDIHYISQQLTDNGTFFTALVEKSDGKVATYIDPITDAFIDEVIEKAPDALVITGDLSFNGALLSHIDLAKKLETVEQAGIKVLVIPGNHDVNYPYAASYNGDTYKKLEMTTAQQFRDAYAGLNMKDAESTDKYSGSYFYALRDDIWLLMLDTNSLYENTIFRETFDWLEEQLKYAYQNGISVISFSHQNVLKHSNLFFYGYQIYQAEELNQLFRKYGVTVNFSGHLHIQHIAEDNGITEILTSALSVYPHQYGILTISADDISYQSGKLDINKWAENNSIQDNVLTNFSEFSHDFFIKASGHSLGEELRTMNIGSEDIEQMERAFHTTNVAYFSGSPLDIDTIQDGIILWKNHPESFTTIYLNEVWSKAGEDNDHLTWNSALKS